MSNVSFLVSRMDNLSNLQDLTKMGSSLMDIFLHNSVCLICLILVKSVNYFEVLCFASNKTP